MPGYNEKNMKDASEYYKPSEGQKKMEKMAGEGWSAIKGLVGLGEDSDAMGAALKNRNKKYESDE